MYLIEIFLCVQTKQIVKFYRYLPKRDYPGIQKIGMNIILFDNEIRSQLLPLTYTRPVCELRVGILTIKEKWELWLKGDISYITQDYLAEKYPY